MGKKQKKKLLIYISIFVGSMIILMIAFNTSLTVQRYEINSSKIHTKVRIALITDLHSCYYGEGQKELLQAIDLQQPDIILFGGDIADDGLTHENTVTVISSVGTKYPCYYVSGNHEYRSNEIDEIKQIFKKHRIKVLEGENEKVSVNNQPIYVCGVDDVDVGKKEFYRQIEMSSNNIDTSLYTVFLAHRPEYIHTYLDYDFDLILSGHAHGGQWRIPGLLNGLLAPNQGFFPKYAGGRYDFNEKTFIVSRGLAKETTRVPRIFNPPELVIIDITPLK